MFNENGNITFDFLVNQIEVLTEMARPVSGVTPDYTTYFEPLAKQASSMLASGLINGEPITVEVPEKEDQEGNTIETKTVDIPGLSKLASSQQYRNYYLFWILMKVLNGGEYPTITNNNSATQAALEINASVPKGPQGRGPALPMIGIKHIISTTPEVVKSEDFKREILDEENIKQFLISISEYKNLQQTHNISGSKTSAEKRAEKFGFDEVGKYEQMTSDPLYSKFAEINRVQGIRNKKRGEYRPEDPMVRRTTPEGMIETTDDIQTALKLLSTKSSIIKKQIVAILNRQYNLDIETIGEIDTALEAGEIEQEDIIDVYDMIGDRHDLSPVVIDMFANLNIGTLKTVYNHINTQYSGGITPEQFQELIYKISEPYETTNPNPKVFATLNVLPIMVDRMIKLDAIQKNKRPYGRFDKDIVERILPEIEDRKKFRNYILSDIHKKRYEEWSQHWAKSIQDYELQFGKDIPTELDKELKPSPTKMMKNIEKARHELETDVEPDDNEFNQDYKYDDEENEESYVSQYMTEQVRKDSFNKPKGQFVDRGFKKVKNYHQWLMRNL